MTEQELNDLLDQATTQIGKISKEQNDRFDAVVAANKALQAIIDKGGAITEATRTKAATLTAAIKDLDDAIPDAVPGSPV
jgi:Xaa-Pro aminopeptidase